MASESDCDLITSKRPKTKPIIGQDIDSSSTKSSNEDEIVVKNKQNNAVSNDDIFADHKKAVKRNRESDEESSITSDDEAMSNKRVRKNSDDLKPYRPKKVVSAAARKRREAAKSLRERKIAALETDSEYDSDENVKCEENISRSKQFNSGSENKVSTDSDDYLKAEELSFKKNVRKLDKINDKTCDKNEDSTSAYNSDSQEGVHLQNITKRKKVIELDKEKSILQSPQREISYNTKKIGMTLNSGSELDEDVDDKVIMTANFSIEKEHPIIPTDSTSIQKSNKISHLHGNSPGKRTHQSKYIHTEHFVSDPPAQESKLHSDTKQDNAKQANCSTNDSQKWSSQRSSNIHLGAKKEKKEIVTNLCESECNSETDEKKSRIARCLISNSETNSSNDETLKIKAISKNKDAKVKKNDVIPSSETLKSSTDNSSEDDQPLNKSKQTTLRGKKLIEDRLTNQNSNTSDDEEHRSLSTEKVKKMCETDPSKESQKIQNCSVDTSDTDRPIKKTKSSQHWKEDIEKKKKVVKPSSKKQFSSDESSEDEQPKKTKSSSKAQSNSDSDDSGNRFLKAKPKEGKSSKSKCQQRSKESSSSDEDKPLKKTSDDSVNTNKISLKHSKTGNKKMDFHCLNEEVDISKKENSNSKKNVSKSEQEEIKLKKTHISDGSSDDDKLSKKNKSSLQTKTKIGGRGRVLKQSVKNQNSSDEISSEDEEPLKKTKSSRNKTQTDSDSEKSEENVFRIERKEVQSSKNRCKQNRSDSDDDKPLKVTNSALNKESSVTNPKSKKNGRVKLKAKKKEFSDSGDDSKDIQKGRDITKRIEVKNRKSETSSNISGNESSSSSDVPLAKNSKVKIAIEKSSSKVNPDKASKHSAKSKDHNSSDSENENVKMKQMRKSTVENSSRIKKETSDLESSVKEENSEDQQKKSSITAKPTQEQSNGTDSDSSNKPLKSIKRNEMSETADSSDSEDDKRKIKKSGSKESHEVVKKKSKGTSSESDSDSNSRTEETKKKRKAPSKMDVRINNLKKYIRAAGIRINNYASVWEGCRSDKQRADRLGKFLEDKGMKGRPTLQKCKKLRVKLEKKREAEDLDLGNIINDDEDTGRYKCRSSRRPPIENKNSEKEKEAAERAAELKQRFSRIKDLIESDSSSD